MPNNRRAPLRIATASLVASLLSACGGGGGGGGSSPPPPPPPPPPPNVAPSFSSAPSATVAENTSVGYTASATDANAGDTLSFSIAGGADATQFSINATLGDLTFASGPDFETPLDADGDNIYEVDLSVSDGNGGTNDLSVAITVTDQSTLELTVTFPTPNAEIGGTSTDQLVAGNITDLEDDEVLPSDVQFINVNGVAATQDIADLSRWAGQVPLTGPSEQIDVTARAADNTDLEASFQITNQVDILLPDAMAVDAANNRALTTVFFNRLVAIDLSSGLRTVIADADIGTGRDFSSIGTIAVDSANNRAYVDSAPATILAVDLATGDRTDISSSAFGVGTGPSISRLSDFELDIPGGRILATSFDLDALMSVEIATGDRTIISDDTTGTGTNFQDPAALVHDVANGRVFVIDQNRLYSVSLNTGDRTILSENYSNTGPVILTPLDMLFDSTNSRVIVSADIPTGNDTYISLVAIDLATGDRSIVADSMTGAGALLRGPVKIAWGVQSDDIVAMDVVRSALFRVSASSGDRSIVSSNDVGAGGNQVGYSYFDTSDDFAIVTNPGVNGPTIYRVNLESGDKSVVASSSVGTGPDLLNGFAIVISDSANIAYMFGGNGPGSFSTFAVDLASGDRTIIASESVGTGPIPSNVLGADIDENANRLYVIDNAQNGLFSIDIATGDRATVSDAMTGSGPLWNGLNSVRIEQGGATALATDSSFGVLYRIDLSSGERSVVADSNTGSGAPLFSGRGLDIDADANVAYISVVGNNGGVVQVDLATGNRTLVADDNLGRGIELKLDGGLRLDKTGRRVFVNGGTVASLIAVDLETGDRAISSR